MLNFDDFFPDVTSNVSSKISYTYTMNATLYDDMYYQEKNGIMTITLDLPGFLLENVDVAISSNNVLEISAKRKYNDDAYFHHIDRKVSLNGNFKLEDIKAELKDGVLTIIFGKRQATDLSSKKILVTIGK